jgi:hypothetical protein
MSYLGYHQLKIKGIDALQNIEQLSINIEPNRHARLRLKGLMQEKIAAQYLEEQLENKPVRLVASDETEQTIFEGQVVDAKIIENKGVSYLELEGLSGTINLALQPKSRSFQNTELTYQEVIRQVIQDIPHCIAKYQVGQNEKIQMPIIQYLEKDWDFIRRLASHFQAVVVPDVTAAYPRFWFGMPEGESHTLEQDVEYRVSKDFGRYHELGGATAGHNPDDFLAYQVRTWRNFAIGDQVRFKGKTLVVGAKKGMMEKGLWVYTYTLAFTPALGLKQRYNTKISGMSLQGKVLETKGERLKVHLDIDQTQDQNTAYWYPWVPTSGNMMYCMPKVDTTVVLYFPNEHEGQARITGCVRTNGAQCAATSDTNNRYFNTEHNKQLALLPAELSFTGTGSKESPLKLSMLEQTGITLENHKNLQLYAKDKIEFSSDKRIYCEAMKSFDAGKMDFASGTPSIKSLMSMKYEVNVVGSKINIEASARESLGEAKKKFSWFKLGVGVLLGLAAVAAVTAAIFFAPVALAAVGVALTASGTAVFTTMAIGAAAGGGIAVVAKGVFDAIDQKNADNPLEYVTKGLAGAVGGAISSFGGGFLSTVAMNAIGGGVGNVAENLMNARLKNSKMDWNQTGKDAYYSVLGSGFGGGVSFGVTKACQRVIGQALAKQTTTEGAKSFMRQYSKKFAENTVKYNKTIAKFTGNVDNMTVPQARNVWESKFVKAFTTGKKDYIMDLGFQETSDYAGTNLGRGLSKGLVKQAQKNTKLFEEAAFQTENALKRAKPDLIGNSSAEVESKVLQAGDEMDKKNIDDIRRSKANNSLLVKGAALKCTCGSKESQTGLLKCNGVYATGIPVLTACNKKVMENIMDFGNCKNPKNKCVPKIVGEWNQAKNDIKINDYFAITTESWLTCSNGGQIKVKESGQNPK